MGGDYFLAASFIGPSGQGQEDDPAVAAGAAAMVSFLSLAAARRSWMALTVSESLELIFTVTPVAVLSKVQSTSLRSKRRSTPAAIIPGPIPIGPPCPIMGILPDIIGQPACPMAFSPDMAMPCMGPPV